MDLLSYLDSGKRLPEKPIILTSDDGYQSIYTNAFPILTKIWLQNDCISNYRTFGQF